MEKRKWILIAIALLGIISFSVYYYVKWHPSVKEAMSEEKLDIQAYKVELLSLPLSVDALGHVEAIQKAELAAEQAGKITQINVFGGEFVEAGSVLLKLDDKHLLADLRIKQAAYNIAWQKHERAQQAFKQHLITADNFTEAQSNFEMAKADLLHAETQYNTAFIKAPFSGTVTDTSKHIGDYVQAGEALLTLVDKRQLKVHYALPLKELKNSSLHQQVIVSSDALAGEFSGEIIYIAPQVEHDLESIKISALINNHDNKLLPGMTVHVKQITHPDAKVIAIPLRSIQSNIDGDYVYLIDDGKAKIKPIKINFQTDRLAIVSEGVNTSDAVITDGIDKLRNGSAVTVKTWVNLK